MCYKNDKNTKFVINRFVFSNSKCTKICFRPGPRWGSLRRSPDPLVGYASVSSVAERSHDQFNQTSITPLQKAYHTVHTTQPWGPCLITELVTSVASSIQIYQNIQKHKILNTGV